MENTLDLVTNEQAIRLKALGFDWETDAYYAASDSIPYKPEGEFARYIIDDQPKFTKAPTVALALKWARSKGFQADISFSWTNHEKSGWEYEILHSTGASLSDNSFPSYEAAESAALDYILKLMNENGTRD